MGLKAPFLPQRKEIRCLLWKNSDKTLSYGMDNQLASKPNLPARPPYSILELPISFSTFSSTKSRWSRAP